MVETVLDRNYQVYLNVSLDEYIGEWVAIADNRLIAHGKKLKEVVEQAKRVAQGKKYLLARVPSESTMIF